jgi:NitT/TauT family transport system ATP-binding protein
MTATTTDAPVTDAYIDVDDLAVSYDGTKLAVSDINLHVGEREFVAVLGPSGCGKSTLLQVLSGLLTPHSGRASIAGRDVTSSTGDPSRIGYVFQDHRLLPWRTVAQNIELPLRFHGMAASARAARVAEMLASVGLEGFGRSFPAELSGGMRKRVALAQLLTYEPNTLLMDEPFGALDAQLKLVMQQQLLGIWRARRQTVVFVTHDLGEAVAMAQRVVVFSGRPGRIKQIETVGLAEDRDVFRVRFLPEFEAAYTRLWEALAPEIQREAAA